jgi:hypothetical protein
MLGEDEQYSPRPLLLEDQASASHEENSSGMTSVPLPLSSDPQAEVLELSGRMWHRIFTKAFIINAWRQEN